MIFATALMALAATQDVALSPCTRAGIEGRVECGTVRVPENRERPAARSLSIFVLVLRASGDPAGEPVFFFTGGPGSAASLSAAYLGAQLAPLRATRDFVFIDQRGTGRSAPLVCGFPRDPVKRLEPMFDPALSAACRAKLQRSADLRFYTTSDAALDVDDVRKALGYERINLHGSSYGTRAAWAYAARFPDRVRAMALHGAAPPGFLLPLPFARGLDAAIDGVVAACAAEPACAARYPSLRRDVARAFDRLRDKPARVMVSDEGGEPREGWLTRRELAEAVRYQLYAVGGAANVPRLLTRAAAGDYTPIAQASVINRRRLEEQLNRGMFLSVTCAEDVPLMSEAAIRASSRGTRLGDYRTRQQVAACRDWPRGESRWWAAPASPGKPAPIVAPALVLNGEFDPATPPEWARRAMALLPNGRLVIVPGGAHGFDRLGVDACIARVIVDFFDRGAAKGVETSCVAAAKRPPFTLP